MHNINCNHSKQKEILGKKALKYIDRIYTLKITKCECKESKKTQWKGMLKTWILPKFICSVNSIPNQI